MEIIRAFIKAILPDTTYRVLVRYYHFLLAAFAAARFGHPSRDLTVIGVTGTNGKTTVVHLLHEMFEAAGFPTASLSSLRFKIREVEESNLLKMTMPGRFELQRFLARAREAKCRYVILEITSEGIRQNRHRFITFRGAVLTNVTPEHIESHGGFEEYRKAKLELFRMIGLDGVAVINREDPSAELFAGATKGRISRYSRSEVEVGNVGRPVRVVDVGLDHIQIEVEGVFLSVRIGGDFNVMNLLAALACAMSFRVSLTAISQSLAKFPGVRGRLEFITRDPFSVVVDYAHTPDALESVYRTLEENRGERIENRAVSTPYSLPPRLICVFGSAGGGRDRWKRPLFGAIAGRYCQSIILTSEDPDDEDPAVIANQIRAGIPPERISSVDVILDRKKAIQAAIERAKPGDTVILTGMGAQPWFMDRGGKIPWDEAAIVREELARVNQVSGISPPARFAVAPARRVGRAGN
jgi:UDP-N-acetylmuramoyl-L-alanyl-D-glutamate--2,6-diaminopimelate ligase